MDESFGFDFPGRREALAIAAAPSEAVLVADQTTSVEFERARHLLIEGDNVDVLKLLRPAYGGRIQMIYIDPPYNRGRDFVYQGIWSASRGRRRGDPGPARAAEARRSGPWMAMMLPRLMLARELLCDEGLIFVSIDDHEAHHLRVLLDEVFGRDRFMGQVIVVSNRGGRDYLPIAVTHEYILCYGRSPAAKIREVARNDISMPYQDDRGPYELRELRNRNPRFTPANRPNLHYPIWVDTQVSDDHSNHPVALEPKAGNLEVVPRNKVGALGVWRWGRAKLHEALAYGDPAQSEVVARRRRDGGYNIYEKYRKQTTKPRSIWDESVLRSEQGSIELRRRFGQALFDHPKPIELVRRCIEIGSDPDGIVLDFFAGSGTTFESVLQQNGHDGGCRRCVLVQRPEPTPEHSAARQAGCASVADITRKRVCDAASEAGVGVRCFRVSNDPGQGAQPGPWHEALAAGKPLEAQE